MLRPKKNSYKEFDNEKKFLRLENPPTPPITFLMVLPLEKMLGLSFPRDKANCLWLWWSVRISEGVRKARFDSTTNKKIAQ